MTRSRIRPLGLCSWSLAPRGIHDLIEQTARVGANGLQLALDPLHLAPDAWRDTGARLREAGIEVLSGMMAPAGEDYTTPATIRATGGLVPDATWDENRARADRVASLAAELGVAVVSLHAGFIPERPADPLHARLVERLQWLADRFADAFGGVVLLETGQETAANLLDFLGTVGRDNVGVNFDPANMLLYDMDDPIAALEALAPHVRQVHLKDARRPAEPGAWGEEVVVGTGEVDWPAFFAVLERIGFVGPLVVEREAGEDRVADMRAALRHIAPWQGGGDA